MGIVQILCMTVAMATIISGCSRLPEANDKAVSCLVASQIGKEVLWHQCGEDHDKICLIINDLLCNPVTLDAAIQIALLNNQDIQATFEDLGIARADLLDAGLLHNPVFDAAFRFPDKSGLNLNTEVSITQAFLDILLIPLRIRVASAAFEKAKIHVAQVVLDLAFDVEETYFNLVAEQKRVGLMEPLIDAAEATLDLSKAQHQQGNISDLELLDHSRTFVQAKIAFTESQVEIIRLKARMNQLLGLNPCEQSWKVADELPPLPIDDVSDTCLCEIALSQRLDLREIRWELERIARLGATKQWWAYTDLAGGLAVEQDTDGTLVRGPALVGAIPIFNYGQGERARLCALYRQNRDLLAALEIQVLAEVDSARRQQSLQRSLVKQYENELIPLQEKIISTSQSLYNYMTLSVYNLLNDVSQQIEMHIQSTIALRDYWIATTRLDRALGGNIHIIQEHHQESCE